MLKYSSFFYAKRLVVVNNLKQMKIKYTTGSQIVMIASVVNNRINLLPFGVDLNVSEMSV